MNNTKQFSFRGFLPFVLAVTAVVAVCEGALYCRPLRERIPLLPPYYVAEVETQAVLAEEVLRETGEIDCLFIGSSVVGHGIRAELFDRELERLTGDRMSSFNGWACALMPSCVEFYLHNFWLKRFRPKVIVQGVRLLYLRSDYTPCEHAALKRGRHERLWLAPSAANGFRVWALNHVMLYRYRGSLRACLRDFNWPPAIGHGVVFDARGGIAHENTCQAPDAAGLAAADPERWEAHTFIRYARETTDRYPRGLAALRRVGEWCREQGVVYVLVNMPEHPDRFDTADGERIYADYLADLRRVAQEVGGELVDVTKGDPCAYGSEDFGPDRIHMNTPGGERFTRALAASFANLNIEH